MMASGKSAGTLDVSRSALEALKNVLEAVNTLPIIKGLAGIGIQLLQYVIVSGLPLF